SKRLRTGVRQHGRNSIQHNHEVRHERLPRGGRIHLSTHALQRATEVALGERGDPRRQSELVFRRRRRADYPRQALFLGAIEHVNRDLPAPVTVAAAVIAQLGLPASFANAIPFHQDVNFYMAKADWIVNSRNRVSVRYMHHSNDSPYDNTSAIGGQYLTSQSYNFVDRSHVGAVQVVSTISSRAVNELRTQVGYRGQANDRFSGSGTGPSLTILGVANFGGPTGIGFVYNETTPEITDTFSYDFGTHALKVGFSTRWIRDTQVQATGALYAFPTIARYLAAASGSNPFAYVLYGQTLGNPSLNYN